ncbi:MAG: hypothetical protein ACAH59_08575, partial [Pseudobdellovibrionaceae bacterium]
MKSMDGNTDNFWKKCSTCKKPIAFGQKYYICSVSTCQGLRTGYSFCSVTCFESHLPGARHRDAGAIEKKAPTQAEAQAMAASEAGGGVSPERRRIIPAQSSSSSGIASTLASSIPHDILIVASKLKDYIRARSEMNTSA